MSGLKISELPILSDIDKADVMPIVDTSGNITKKVPVGDIEALIQKDISPYTFIIDSDEKLAEWLYGTGTNDYSSVLIRGNRSITRTQWPNINSTKIIVGDANSTLNIYNTNSDFFSYSTLPTNNIYMIKNLNINYYLTVGAGSKRYSLFWKCHNVYNCNITLYPISTSAASNYAGIFHTCDNIVDTSININYSQTSYGRVVLLYNCTKVKNLYVRMTAPPVDISSVVIIDASTNIIDCDIAGDANHNFIGIRDSLMCQNNKLTNASYSNSYLSPTADTNYAAANSLNGGWNA